MKLDGGKPRAKKPDGFRQDAAHTISHLHSWSVELARPASREEVLAAFRAAPRIAFLKAEQGMVTLNTTLEMMTDLGRPRGDMWEVGLWEDTLTGIEADGAASIAKTDRALGLAREFVGGAR